jgi:hypothetical protein
MFKCSICGAETPWRANGQPICLKCDRKQIERTENLLKAVWQLPEEPRFPSTDMSAGRGEKSQRNLRPSAPRFFTGVSSLRFPFCGDRPKSSISTSRLVGNFNRRNRLSERMWLIHTKKRSHEVLTHQDTQENTSFAVVSLKTEICRRR